MKTIKTSQAAVNFKNVACYKLSATAILETLKFIKFHIAKDTFSTELGKIRDVHPKNNYLKYKLN